MKLTFEFAHFAIEEGSEPTFLAERPAMIRALQRARRARRQAAEAREEGA
jgi:hypothetical protein